MSFPDGNHLRWVAKNRNVVGHIPQYNRSRANYNIASNLYVRENRRMWMHGRVAANGGAAADKSMRAHGNAIGKDNVMADTSKSLDQYKPADLHI